MDTLRPNIKENTVEQYTEVSSNLSLGHSTAVGYISSSLNDNNNFASEIPDVFCSNLGSGEGICASIFTAPMAVQRILGESGIEQRVNF